MVSWTLAASVANFATRPGIAGTRMLSDIEPMPDIAIRSAIRLQGVRRGCAARAVGSWVSSMDGLKVQCRPTGRVAAASQARVSASTSGESVSATRA